MNRELMKNEIREEITKKLGSGFTVTVNKVLKTNVKLDGLSIMNEGENLAPTIYLQGYYHDLENGADLSDVVDDIIQTYHSAKCKQNHFDVNSIFDFNKVKESLFVKIINKTFNKELLEDVPYINFLDDFAITLHCLVEVKDCDVASFLVHNKHLEIWNTDTGSIFEIAKANTRVMFGVDLRSMEDVLKELIPTEFLSEIELHENVQFPMFVLTNNQKFAGSSCVLFDDILKDFADKHGSFYVIFSSVHECLLVPNIKLLDASHLTTINQEVNLNEVKPDEVLGTKAYYYDAKTGFVV